MRTRYLCLFIAVITINILSLTYNAQEPAMAENQQADILITNDIADLELLPRGPEGGEPVKYTFNNRFSFDHAIESLSSIRNILASFTILTQQARKIISKEKMNKIGYTSWEEQTLGFSNTPNAVEGTLRKQEYLLKKLSYELAGYKLKSGEINQDKFKEIEKEYQKEKASFQNFWNEFQIAD